MSRITCKTCRRLGESICGREKCAYKKRPYAPGKLDSERKHRTSSSEYGEQLRAKQKVRISYGLLERQFSMYAARAMKANETSKDKVSPELRLYRILESRLDNVVYRMGLAHTRALARQMVSHGHILVNGRRCTIASRIIFAGDVIGVREGSKTIKPLDGIATKIEKASSIPWITADVATLTAKVVGEPREIEPVYDFQKVLEFYSR